MRLSPFRRKPDPNSRRSRRSGEAAPQPAYSYYASKNTAYKSTSRKSQGPSRPRDWRRLRMIPTLTALTIILGSIVFSTTLTTSPVVNFVGDSSPYHSDDVYREAAQSLVEGSIFNRSKLTINTGKIEEKLLRAYPELDAAELSLPVIGRRPTLTLHLRRPVLILASKQSTLIVDSNGVVISEAALVSSAVKDVLPRLQDESGLDIKVGFQVLTAETIAFIDNITQQLTAKGLVLDRLVLPKVANEIDIFVKDQNYFIRADITGDARLQMGAFLATRDKLKDNLPKEYVDVRVEEKVFYK